MLPLEEHQRCSLDHYMRTVTVRRSDGPRPSRNNPGWRSYLLSDAAVTKPRHAVIAVSLPVGLNTGSLAQCISVRSCEVPLRRCRIHPAAQERRFLQALIPGREEPPGTPRFRRACRLDPIGVEPRFSLRQHRSTVHSAHPSIPHILATSRLPPPGCKSCALLFPHHQLTGGIHHRDPPDCPSQFPCPISP